MENTGEVWQAALSKTVGEAIFKRRKELGLTALALSERCSEMGLPIHRTTITKIEKGRARFDLGELLVIAHVLGTSPAALLFAHQLVDGEVEISPGNRVPAFAALMWFSGELDYDEKVRTALKLNDARRDVEYVTSELDQASSTVTDETLQRALSAARNQADTARSKGLIVRGSDG